MAGAVALLWSAWPPLRGDVEATEQILRDTATPVATADCAGGATVAESTQGNNVYGAGLLNVDAAVARALAMAANPTYMPIVARSE